MSSPLRRVLSVSLLVAGLSLAAPAVEARVRPTGPNDSSFSLRFDGTGVLDRVWAALSRLWAAEGSRIDPNGHP
jgi:hypothetical protein